MTAFTKYCLTAVFSWLVVVGAYAARVDTLDISSVSMHKVIRAAVLVPRGYAVTGKRYPVVYLLHGGQGSYRDWLTKLKDKQLLHTQGADRKDRRCLQDHPGS